MSLRLGSFVALCIATVVAILIAIAGPAWGAGAHDHVYPATSNTPNDTASGFHGTWVGEPSYIDGATPGDPAFFFAGSNHISLPTGVGEFGTDDFVVDVFVESQNANPVSHAIVANRDGCGGGLPFWSISTEATGQVRAEIGDGGTSTITLFSSTDVFGGAFHRVTFMRLGEELYLLIDGVVEASNLTGATFYNITSSNTNIAWDDCVGPGGRQRWNGRMDNLTIGNPQTTGIPFVPSASNLGAQLMAGGLAFGAVGLTLEATRRIRRGRR